MADYKRMVSYMYQYENGVKRKNVGYARIEAKSGQCKITLHMQLLGQLDSIFPTYLIQRNASDMELIYLGDAVLKNQIMDSKLVADENNIMDTGLKLSDMGGMLLFLNEYIFFASEWDDKPIVAEEVLEALKPKDQRSRKKETKAIPVVANPDKEETIKDSQDKEVQSEDTQGEGVQDEYTQDEEVQDEYTQDEEVQDEDTQDEEAFVDVVKVWEAKVKEAPEEIVLGEAVEESIVEETSGSTANHSPETGPAVTPVLAALTNGELTNGELTNGELTPEQQATMPKYMLPRGWKTIERMQYPHSSEKLRASTEILTAAHTDRTKVFNVDGNASEDILPDKDLMEMLMPSDIEINNLHEMAESQETNARSENNYKELEDEKPDHPTAQNIFDRYTRIYPFEDNEIILCVKIEPKDIGLLPKEYWPLSNNSFLMHGYYCYHHLVFAKIKDRCGCRYLLGIPGIFHNRERFMAKMFGFDNFKSIRKRELRQGDFGYWYQQINF